ncbi:heterokaryon incompatibility protein-domain-containing protein [Xylaria grammica]|nr:heterokaryon incompatibility protein-domain-containing protein [Xylaria grammica]
MRLLNTTTLEIKEFIEGQQEPYAILSHRWGYDEVVFQDLKRYYEAVSQGLPTADSVTTAEGFRKIQNCCKQALEDGFRWVWIDTCCIDKSSSAELSEAINSMFRWYRNSAVCYVFMCDVPETSDKFADVGSSFYESKWFTRGWTLQELLAPSQLRFFNERWELLGQMTSRSDLCRIISSITRIPINFLTKRTPLSQACVAKKMSWASRRKTTREEDIAYCLLGIFDINMPLLYGEGAKAFTRLQEYIIQQTYDNSILAWGKLDPDSDPYSWRVAHTCDALAHTPADFEDCHDFEYLRHANPENPEFKTTNLGLQISLPVHMHQDGFFPSLGYVNRYYVGLDCFSWRFPGFFVGIGLQAGVDNESNFVRLSPHLTLKDRPRKRPWPRTIERPLRFRSFTIVKPPTTPMKWRTSPDVVFNVPEDFTWKVQYCHPDVKVEKNGDQATDNSLEVWMNVRGHSTSDIHPNLATYWHSYSRHPNAARSKLPVFLAYWHSFSRHRISAGSIYLTLELTHLNLDMTHSEPESLSIVFYETSFSTIGCCMMKLPIRPTESQGIHDPAFYSRFRGHEQLKINGTTWELVGRHYYIDPSISPLPLHYFKIDAQRASSIHSKQPRALRALMAILTAPFGGHWYTLGLLIFHGVGTLLATALSSQSQAIVSSLLTLPLASFLFEFRGRARVNNRHARRPGGIYLVFLYSLIWIFPTLFNVSRFWLPTSPLE